MRETKAYIALETLSVYEMNRLKKFVRSPYFNSNQQISTLFDILDTNIRDSKAVDLKKQTVWAEIHDSSQYNDTKFRKLCSDLLKLIEKFLAQEQFDNNPLHKANYLLKAVNVKKLEKLYSSSISTARRLSNQQLEKTASFYYYQYQIEKNLLSLTSEFEKKAKVRSNSTLINISDIAHNLDVFYLAEKIKYQCSLLAYKKVFTIEEEVLFIEDIIRQIKIMDYENIPPISIWYQIYLTITEPEYESHFKKLKNLIEKYLNLFPFDEAKIIYESAVNYCVSKVNSGKSEYFQEIFELYEYGIENKILLTNNEISPTSFRNVSITALRLGYFDWTENFILKNQALLNPKYRDNAVTFNLARLATYRKEFDKVIDYLREVSFDDMFYELSSKALQLSAYYELDEIEVLESFLSSFRTFLRRNTKIPQRRKNNYLKLVTFTQKLIKLDPHMKSEIRKLQQEIQDSENFSDKKWILEKIRELQGLPAETGTP